jgi:hypothetical protein
MADGDVHVRRRSTGWRVEIEGSGRSHSRFATQSDAWEAGKTLARRKGRNALLYGRDDRVRMIYDGGSRDPSSASPASTPWTVASPR